MITIRVWRRAGRWRYDVRSDGPPASRFTGERFTYPAAAEAALGWAREAMARRGR